MEAGRRLPRPSLREQLVRLAARGGKKRVRHFAWCPSHLWNPSVCFQFLPVGPSRPAAAVAATRTLFYCEGLRVFVALELSKPSQSAEKILQGGLFAVSSPTRVRPERRSRAAADCLCVPSSRFKMKLLLSSGKLTPGVLPLGVTLSLHLNRRKH